MHRKLLWCLLGSIVLLTPAVVHAQLRMFNGKPGPGQPPGQRRAFDDDQPKGFTGAMPPAPKVPGVPFPAGFRPASEVDGLVTQAIQLTSQRRIDVRSVPPWAITHAVLALRQDLVLFDGSRNVNGIEWISNQARFWNAAEAKNKGLYWFEATQHGGRAQPFDGTPYEFEGHTNQTLALLAMSNLPREHEFIVAGGRRLTMNDMIRHAQMNASKDEEITWTLWLLVQYLDPDTQWTNAKGQRWSMEYLVQLQNQAEVTSAPCGGTHGLFALAYARNSYLKKHGKLQGVWLSADMKVQQYVEAAKALQNPDGSFSTMFFRGRGQGQAFNERIKSSGHILEMLMMALPQSRLREEWVQKGVYALAKDLVQNANQPGDCGPLYHSLHALNLYRLRIASEPSQPAEPPALVLNEPLAMPALEPAPQPLNPVPDAQPPAAPQGLTESSPAPGAMSGPAVTAPSVAAVTPPLAAPPQGQSAAELNSTPRPLPLAELPAGQLRPLGPAAPDFAAPIPVERPVPEVPQKPVVSTPQVADGKPLVDAAPLLPNGENSLLSQAPTTLSPPPMGERPLNEAPPRVAQLEPQSIPQPRLMVPVPLQGTSREPAPAEPQPQAQPTQVAEKPRAIRIIPGAPAAEAAAPNGEPSVRPVPKPAATNRLFIPLSPEKLKALKEQQLNEVPAAEAVPSTESVSSPMSDESAEQSNEPAPETPVEAPANLPVVQPTAGLITPQPTPIGPLLPTPRGN